MSHVAEIDLHIKDLSALESAAKSLGLEFRRNQKTYRWFGRSVGDYPVPAGYKASDLGKCDHAIGIPNNDRAYEVGVVPRRDGKPGYTLMWDFWAGGHGLEAIVGKDCSKLKQAYTAEVASRKVRMQGYSVRRETLADGSVRLVCVR